MQPIFEAKYLAIKWFDKDIVSSITESVNSIKIEVENPTSYYMEVQAYKRIENGYDGQVAFRIYDATSDIHPYLIDANGDSINLLKIIDPNTKKAWWIEDGNWSNQYKCRMSELWNHVGKATAYFGNVVCNTDIRTISFTAEQLNLYLEDFKNDFWWLILKKNSLTQAEGRNSIEQIKILNEQTINLIQEFIKHTQNILKNPKKELKEIQGIKDFKKVKPVAKTFMEIATGGMKRKMTSRDTIESYNVAENKYIHYALFQVYTIVLKMTKASQYINNFYQNKAKSEQQRVEKFTNKKIIDKEVYENEIYNLEKKIEKIKYTINNVEQVQNINIKEQCEKEINTPTLQDLINQAIQKQNIQQRNENDLQTIYLQLGERKDYQEKMQFKGTLKLQNGDDWYQFTNQNNSYSLDFNKNIFDGIVQKNTEYKVVANIVKSQQDWATYNRKGTIYKRYFAYIAELIPLDYIEPERNLIYQTLYINLTRKQDVKGDRVKFFGNGDVWDQLAQNNFYSLEFDKNIFDGALQEYTQYKVSAYIQEYTTVTQNGNTAHNRYFKYITNIEQATHSQIENQLQQLSNQINSLIATDWARELTYQEGQEQQREKEAIESQIKLLNEESKTSNEYIKQLEPLTQSLKNLLTQFDKLSIAKDNYFPNSMTFVQNPHYQGGYNYFKAFIGSVGIDENLFLSIQKVEKIGLLDIPTLYERWCFLQIIKVLIDQYHFLPSEENWKKELMLQMVGNTNEVRSNIRNISISFENPLLERKIILHYEKELNGHNSKRPDYLLETISLRNDDRKHNLIMDAKFREDVKVKDLIEELYHYKNYSQNNNNTVFILHPDANKSIPKKLTDKEWGNDAYYGEVQMFDYTWDNDNFPNHKYGSILLSPIRDEAKNNYGNYLDNLQRLIGMAMQYQLEDNTDIINHDRQIDPEPKEKIFCLKCGGTNFQGTRNPTRNNRGFRYNLSCTECKHVYVYNYCQSCKTRLIKNGRYWSYHASQILEPFNIKCPNCNQIFISDNEHKESEVKQITNHKNTAIQNIKKNEVALTNQLVFNNYEDGFKYVKENPDRILTRNPNGSGWIIKT